MNQDAIGERELQEQVAAQVAFQAMRDPMRVLPRNLSAPAGDQLTVVRLKPVSLGNTLDPNARAAADNTGVHIAVAPPSAQSPIPPTAVLGPATVPAVPVPAVPEQQPSWLGQGLATELAWTREVAQIICSYAPQTQHAGRVISSMVRHIVQLPSL